jgi:probable HAF family extracellular repeat protein
MRIALTCATLVTTLALAAPLPALAAAHYHLAPQTRAAKYGLYFPVALTDYGLAAGTLALPNGTIPAYFSAGKSFSDDDFCGAIGAPGATAITGISRDAALTYTVGTCNGQHFSYLYNQATNTTTAVQYPGSVSTFTYGVNANGLAVAEWIGSSTHGFALVGTNFRSIDVPGGYGTVALGVTAQNGIFGNYDVAPSGYYGFVMSPRGAITTINYPNSTYTGLAGLNTANLAVGFYTDTANHLHAFAWQNGTYLQPKLHGSTGSRATGVNENGDVVGWYVDTSNIYHGFVWQPATNKIIKVNGPLGSTGINITAVNNTNAQITGSYTNSAGREVAFIGTSAGTSCF